MLPFLVAFGGLLNLSATVDERRRVLPSAEVDLLLFDCKVNRFVGLAVFTRTGATCGHGSVPARYLRQTLNPRFEHRRSVSIGFLGAVVLPHHCWNAYLALFVDAFVHTGLPVSD